MENAAAGIEERGRSMYGRVYKRRECTSCENCNHGAASVDVLGDKLAAVLNLNTAPVAAAPPATNARAGGGAAPKSDVPMAVASEPAVSRAAPKKKEGKGKTGGKTAAAPRIRTPLARKASNKIDTEAAAAAPNADSAAPVKKAPMEKKGTEAVKKNERKSTKPAAPQEKTKTAKDDKENRPRASTRKVRSVMEL